MTDKIYEYKDDKNWFIGKWGGHSLLSHFAEPMSNKLYLLNQQLATILDRAPLSEESWLAQQGYDVLVIRLSSQLSLIDFVLSIINQETERQLVAEDRNGAIFITEGQQVVQLILPQGGLPLEQFTKIEDKT
ncbi:hypothetical protein ACVRZR_05085 [Streptococcus entericus]|uniref:hypothetical protein n=1 Tax=Streptococcus entericus TaxID=155680 RepID=UPI00035F3839|nr:hypothetical protein [Streptococcus entericus]